MAKSTTNKKLKDVSIEFKKTGPSKKLPKEPIRLKLNNSGDIKNSLETICKIIESLKVEIEELKESIKNNKWWYNMSTNVYSLQKQLEKITRNQNSNITGQTHEINLI